MIRIDVNASLFRWARDRASLTVADLASRFPHVAEWESGNERPTMKQLERFAKATYTPIGFFFLERPPVESVPIPDYRKMPKAGTRLPSPHLLDTIYLCQQRQEWYRNHARSNGEGPREFVGSARVGSSVEGVAASMRQALGFDVEERRTMPSWAEALRQFIEQADALGILVMCSGVVGNNNSRPLDPKEFRGFALADAIAPLVFVNGADTKSAQMFTIAHELAHVWLGASALSNAQPTPVMETQSTLVGADPHSSEETERWCNRVAAELLVPLDVIRDECRPDADLRAELDRLARRFKVSTLVVLRRMHDAGAMTRDEFWQAYEQELERLLSLPRGSGGNFYSTVGARAGKSFTRALIGSALEGQTSFTDAMRMLGISKMSTFDDLGRSFGVIA